MDNFFQPVMRKSEPDWFRLGRDAARVMNQLNGMKELDFYLRHPEPFIRLQAIRRVAVLLLPDAIHSLGKMLDDPIENEQNRDEAGWAIRRISRAKGLSWFAHNPYTDKYDGTEPPSSRFGITVLPGESPSMAAIPVGFEEDARLEDEVLLRIQMDEKGLEVAFSPIHWITANFRHLAVNLVKGLLRLIKGIGLGLFLLMKALGKGLATFSKRIIQRMKDHGKRVRDAKALRIAAQESAIQCSAIPRNYPAAASETAGKAGQIMIPESAAASDITAQASPNLLAGNPAFSLNSDKQVLLIGLEEAISSGTVRPPDIGFQPESKQPGSSNQTSIQSAFTNSDTRQNHAMSASSQAGPARTVSEIRNASPSLGNALSGLSRHTSSVRPAYRRRKGGNTMFRLLFYPVRLVKAHWLFTLIVLIVFYGLLGFTHTGRFFMSRLNPAVLWSNDRFVSVAKLTFMDFFDIDKQAMPSDASSTSAPNNTGEITQASVGESAHADGLVPQYRVTATKGLSLRAEPSKTASRILLMPAGTKVAYEGERDKDADAGEWMKISVEGKTGWAMAQWLESVSTAEKTGGSDGNP